MSVSNDPYTDNKPWQQYNVRDNKIYEAVTVLRGLADMEHPAPAGSGADFHIERWKNSEAGQWCIEKAIDSKILKEPDHAAFGYRYAVRCLFTPKDATFYRMKWG